MADLGESAPAAVGRLHSRNRRRYGGYIIHLGVVMIALGVVGDAYFKSETQYLCKNNFRFSIEESKKRVE
ncbi:MAG: hypothetical protein HY784_02725 [Chloroflexi bacterium]|nr:hypothetical protein [Chloroflexota bacterium]